MARFGLLIFALALLPSSADSWARDKNGTFTTHGGKSCGHYLDAYSRSTLSGGTQLKGTPEALTVFGWINGWLSAYNALSANGKKNILGGMTPNGARRWVATWCLDNPSKDVDDAIGTLTRKLER